MESSASEPSRDAALEASAFEQAARRYVKLATLTNKLEVLREEREFDRATTRYARFRDFTQKLQAQHDREQEHAFNQNVSSYLRKQAFTRRLVENRRRSAE
jgi:hypothetical protein